MKDPHLLNRIQQYLNLLRPVVNLKSFLGDGTDGEVWSTERSSAVKAFNYERGCYNERDTYARLAEYGITNKLDGFWIPKMIGYDDELMVVEMDLMQSPPYIIDFAKVKIDRPPDFSDETIEYHEQQGQERFGSNWPVVKSLMATLESYQIYYLDPTPSNIVFPNSIRDWSDS
jgi:hypothetical protein